MWRLKRRRQGDEPRTAQRGDTLQDERRRELEEARRLVEKIQPKIDERLEALAAREPCDPYFHPFGIDFHKSLEVGVSSDGGWCVYVLAENVPSLKTALAEVYSEKGYLVHESVPPRENYQTLIVFHPIS